MEKSEITIGSYVPDFELPGTHKQVHHLGRYLETYKAIAVIFLSNTCPYVRSYLNRLKQLQKDLDGQRVTIIGINSNDSQKARVESLEQMQEFANEYNLNFPYIRDTTQDVAGSFGACVTPEAFLINNQARLCYRGGIDDQPNSPEKVNQNYLRDAIIAVIKQEPIKINLTKAVGTPIIWRN